MSWQIIGTWFVCTIAVERASEIVSTSKIFAPLREGLGFLAYPKAPPVNILYKLFITIMSWSHVLLTCGYCLSVWFSLFFSYNLIDGSDTIMWIIAKIFTLHGLANIYHVIYELLRRGRIGTYDLVVKLTQEKGSDNGSFGESPGTGVEEIKQESA